LGEKLALFAAEGPTMAYIAEMENKNVCPYDFGKLSAAVSSVYQSIAFKKRSPYATAVNYL